MIDAESYLSSLASHKGDPKPSTASHLLNPESDLPLEILEAAQRGWSVVPLRPRIRKLPSRKSLLGYPTSDLVQLRHWAYPDAQWAVRTGPGSVVIVELDSRIGRYSLQHLCSEDWNCGWPDTLQYRAGRMLFAVFRHPGVSLRRLGSRFPGLKVHSNDLVLMPPSSFAGAKLEYVDPDASILPAPPSLVATEAEVLSADSSREGPQEPPASMVHHGNSAA